jgi:putative MATE family efflux protein
MKPFDREIVSGSIYKSVWKLAWPVTLLNLVNGAQGFVDHVLVGHFIPSANNAANAAIGVAWQMFLVIVVFVASIFHGSNVLIARYAGRQDRENLSSVAYQAFLSAVWFLAIVIAPLGYWASPYLLRFVAATEEVQRYSLPYLRIMFTCGTPLFLVFLFGGVFQASGEPKTALKMGIFCTALNITLSSLLITGAGPLPQLGTSGAALGTVLATTVTVFVVIGLIAGNKTIVQLPRRFTIFPDWKILKIIVRIGVPTGVQGVLLNLGGVFLLKFIDMLPHAAAAQAAYTICYAQLFSLVTWAAFGMRAAASTIMGQNIGAGNPQRGKRGVAVSAAYGLIWAIAWGIIFWTIPHKLLGLFNATEEPTFSYGQSLLRYMSVSGLALAAALALTGGLQGAGETRIPMYIAFISQIVVLLGVCGIFKFFDALTVERVWLAILISHVTRLFLTYAVFRTEKWAYTRLEID